ncbi:MAG: hypothetical protein HYT27_02485, partial [Parcubacteria group bacterium]|nr:hypothetical protein [Parcubacteria group bacterium]
MNMYKNYRTVILVIIVAIVLLGGYFLFGREKSSEFETVTVVRGPLVQEVSITGR